MSHRVTTQTEIKDRELALGAFKAAGIKFRDLGSNTFEVTTGRSTATLNLTNGQIEGDDMRWKEADFDVLKQHYAEQSLLWNLRRQGHTVQNREVNKEGDIVILYQTTG